MFEEVTKKVSEQEAHICVVSGEAQLFLPVGHVSYHKTNAGNIVGVELNLVCDNSISFYADDEITIPSSIPIDIQYSEWCYRVIQDNGLTQFYVYG